MPTYEVTSPDGKTWEVTAPEGATQDQVLQYAKQQWSASMKPADAGRRTANNTIAGQVGLAARAGIKGVAAVPAMLSDAATGVVNAGLDVFDSLANRPKGFRFPPAIGALDDALTRAGLPTPDTPTQRIVSKGVELGGGAAGTVKAVGAAADRATGVAKEVLSRMAAGPVQQTAAGVGAGLAGQHAQENGAGPLGQFISATGGGLAGAGAVTGANALGSAIRSALPQQRQITIQRANQVINIALERGGIDPATISPAMRNMMMEQVTKALGKGDTLDENAVARLADYARLGATPTRGRLTLDPFDITQEQNVAKLAAATGARDAKLPAIMADNNRTLLGAVDEFNPLADPFTTGSRAMSPIKGVDGMMSSAKNKAYKAAEEMAGGDIPLQRAPFMDAIYSRLNAGNLLRHVPANVQSMLDDISSGVIRRGNQTFEVPFNVSAIDTLKSLIATEQRAAQGSAKMALAEIRKALDSVPLDPVKRTFGGNQVVTEAGAKFLRDQDAQAGAVKEALDKARGLNYRWMQWRESAPGIKAAVEDENPATFVQRYVRAQGADARDVAKVAEVINRDPGARDAVRSELVQFLKDAAIGKGNASETGNFSGRGWQSALTSIGPQKLAMFFSPDEVQTLRSIGRVGTYETFQPRGSAVNNSNTAAAVGAMLKGISERVAPFANKVPLGREVITNPLESMTLSVMQRGATNIPNALLSPSARPQGNALDPLLIPGLLGANLLLAPPPVPGGFK